MLGPMGSSNRRLQIWHAKVVYYVKGEKKFHPSDNSSLDTTCKLRLGVHIGLAPCHLRFAKIDRSLQ